MLEKIISFAHDRFLMWAEPDEGSYNWKMFSLGSRYNRKNPIIPDEIKKYVEKNASPYYPVAIVDGHAIDTKLDIRNGSIFTVRKKFDFKPFQIIDWSS